jgi:hypothetical protein
METVRRLGRRRSRTLGVAMGIGGRLHAALARPSGHPLLARRIDSF